jgi:outer membrane autotransporter protein
LSLSVSHTALAACPSTAPTGGDDTITCDSASGAIDLDTGNDKITVNEGADLTGGINGNVGNDLVVVNGGTFYDIAGGNAAASQTDTDRIFVFGGNATGAELQSGSGVDPFVVFMGGTVTATDRGSMEIRRGSTGAVLVIDGGQLLGNGEFEIQDGNGTLDAAKDVTVYFRSGVIETEEELEGNSVSNTFIFDPVNSKDKSVFQDLANDAANGGDPSLSTTALKDLLFSAPANPDEDHQMILNVEEVDMGGGDDKVSFVGAVNNGDAHHNLELNGEDGEVTEFNGGDGDDDEMLVTGGSNLLLGEVENFEELKVEDGSTLTLGESEYEFEDSVKVDGTSMLVLTGSEVTLTTGHFELRSGDGLEERLDGLPAYYADFETGGVLKIGATGGGDADDDDEDDDDAITTLADDDDDDDDAPAGGPAEVRFNITSNTTFVNNGTIDMLNGVVGDEFEIKGQNVGAAYQSVSGNLAIDTTLGGSGSPTDKLEIDDASVSGTTTVYVNNVGGHGAFTGQGPEDGIEVVRIEDAVGNVADDAFQLGVNAYTGQREVIGGAFAYRMFGHDNDEDGKSFYLQSDILDEVPAYATAASVAQRFAAAGVDTLYKRLGEVRLGNNGADREFAGGNGTMWARGMYSDFDVDPKAGYGFSQQNDGVLMGVDTRFRNPDGNWLVGVFGGYGTADADVDATIWGSASRSHVDLTAWSFGAYATFFERSRAGEGLYIDAVAKADILDFDMSSDARGNAGSTDGYAATTSAETGYGFGLGGGVTLQPQAQLTYTTVNWDSFSGPGGYAPQVGSGANESLVGRAGLQLQGVYQTSGGKFAPYAIVNVLSDFWGDNETIVGGTPFKSDMGMTWYSVGGGLTAEFSQSLAVYGSAEYDLGDLEGWGGTGGVKMRW